jgi:hypothetical protein
MPGSDLLLMRAGLGWREGLVGQLILDGGHGAALTHLLSSGRPVIVEDGRAAHAFGTMSVFAQHGICSGVCVVMPGDLRPAGFLGAYSTEPHRFGEEDAWFLQAIANILAAAIVRKGAEEGMLQTQARLQSVQKMEAIGRLAEWHRARLQQPGAGHRYASAASSCPTRPAASQRGGDRKRATAPPHDPPAPGLQPAAVLSRASDLVSRLQHRAPCAG